MPLQVVVTRYSSKPCIPSSCNSRIISYQYYWSLSIWCVIRASWYTYSRGMAHSGTRYRGQIFLLFPGIIHSLVLWNINHSELSYCYWFGSCKISLKNFTLTVDQLAKISILRKHCRNFWLPYWGLIGRDLFINCISSQSLEFSFPSYE